ncbi:MAG: glycosyltransferase family 4 protein [Oceanicaulis sp.]
MNILQVIPELDAGGAERTTIEIAQAVAEAGGTCLVASCGGRLEAELEAAGGELVRLDMKTKNPLAVWRNAARLADLIEARGVDLVHARSRAPAWSAYWAAKRTGRPFVTTYHGIYRARSGLKRWVNSVMARGDRVIANSEFTAAHVRDEHGVGEDRLRVIPRGVDLQRFDPERVPAETVAAMRARWGVADGELAVLLPGRLTEIKGQAFLIDALADFDRRDAVRLVCAGDAQGRESYRTELAETAERSGVKLALPGHETDMPTAYKAADLVVCPSVKPETFGRTVAEAQAMGAPVIAADHGGMREVVEDGVTGWRAAPSDAQAWRAAIAAALDAGPAAREEMSKAARARVVTLFSDRALKQATLQVYRELIE